MARHIAGRYRDRFEIPVAEEGDLTFLKTCAFLRFAIAILNSAVSPTAFDSGPVTCTVSPDCGTAGTTQERTPARPSASR